MAFERNRVKRTALADYRVVYFASHGLVAGDIAGLVEPSLALTLPTQPTDLDDGLLTTSEVAQLKLNADWTTGGAHESLPGILGTFSISERGGERGKKVGCHNGCTELRLKPHGTWLPDVWSMCS